jgi:hypothetical protein
MDRADLPAYVQPWLEGRMDLLEQAQEAQEAQVLAQK